MNVSAIIVTRGDVPLQPVLDSLPPEWEKIVWDNGNGGNPSSVHVRWKDDDGVWLPDFTQFLVAPDLSVYGRYAAIEHSTGDLIYVQDDDVIVSDPQELVDAWDEMETLARIEQTPDSETAFLVANMPQEFRHDGYTDSCLVGFGACFHRDAPARAFARIGLPSIKTIETWPERLGPLPSWTPEFAKDWRQWFYRTCDVAFTTLTPRVLVDVPKSDREFAEDEGRMYRTPGHVEERQRMLELARQVRDTK